MAKVALLIGISDYAEGLKPLPAAPNDVAAMQEVLQNPDLGGFDQVKPLVNPDHGEMAIEIELWLRERQRDDLTVLFFSGHGVKDEFRELYFAARDTRKIHENLIQATAVSASFVRKCLRRCKSKRQVVILDCCFSGAFGDLLAKDDGFLDLESQLGTEGAVVLTSSSSLQYSFEQEGSDLSIYTRYLVEGIQTGAADQDGDGVISVDELHQFASQKVQTTAPAMTPKIIVLKELGYKIKLAKAFIGNPKLKYRKEVERRINQGRFSIPARRLLERLGDELGLSSDETDAIEAEVLQPYLEHQRKLEEYEDTLREALQNENLLSERTRNDLKDYQKHLGLSDKDVARIEQKIIPLPEFKEQEAQERKQIAKEIARRLIQHRQSRQSEQNALALSETLTDNLRSDKDIDYTNLQYLLATGQWKKADEETLDIMLKITKRETAGWLEVKDIESFPCTDLRTIDTLWVKYSNNRFGFSVQKRIWESVGGTLNIDYETYKSFGDRVRWRVNNCWLDYLDLTFTSKAPEGHLPNLRLSDVLSTVRFMNMGERWKLGIVGGMLGQEWVQGATSSLISRLVDCKI